MSEPKNGSVGRDALGILLIAVAFLTGVGVVMSMVRPVTENPSGFTALYTGLVEAIGPVAGLFLSLGLLVIGIRLWIAGFNDRVGRDLFGVLLSTLALAILVGTVTPDLAGSFGNVIGGSVSRRLTMFVGLPFGLVCVLLPAWLFWLRGRILPQAPAASAVPVAGAAILGQTVAPSAPPAADVQVRAIPSSPYTAAAPGRAISEPGKPPRDVPKPETAPPSPPSVQRPPATYSVTQPHNDVRVRGGVPAGAQALAPLHVQPDFPSPHRTSTLPAGSPVGRGDAGERPGQDLAAAVELADEARLPDRDDPRPAIVAPVVAAPELAGRATAPEPRVEAALSDVAPPHFDEADEAPVVAEFEPPPAAAVLVDGVTEVTPVSARPPQPSWEQPSLFDEEPVDAYGTPLSLVDALRKANEDTAERLSDAPTEAAATVAEPAAPAPGGLFDEAPAVALNAHAEDADDADDADSADEQDDGFDEEEGEDDGDQEHGIALAVLDEDELEDALNEEDELNDEDSLSDEDDDLEDGDDLARDAEQPKHAARAPGELAPVAAIREQLPAVVLQPVAPPAAPVEEPVAIADEDEVLVAHAPEREIVPDALAADDVVYRAGLLFVERGRVAVSMLQREFGLDFKAATEVLDQLQKAGLIGPYLGGQRRDILLTREQWAQRVGVA